MIELGFVSDQDEEKEEEQETMQSAQVSTTTDPLAQFTEELKRQRAEEGKTPIKTDYLSAEEDDVSFLEKVGAAAERQADALVYGIGRKGILGTLEFVSQAPVEFARVVHGGVLSNTIAEAGKGALKGILSAAEFITGAEDEEYQLALSNLYGNTFRKGQYLQGKNLLDYVDIFNSHTALEETYDNVIYENINKGIDFITSPGYKIVDGKPVKMGEQERLEKGLRITNFFSTKDAQGNVIKGDYLKFVDHVFKAYEVPVEQQDYVSRVLMTGGEFAVPIGAYRTAVGKLGESTADVLKRYRVSRARDYKNLKKIARKTESELSKGKPKSAYQKSLEKSIENSTKKIDELAFHQRHYGDPLAMKQLANGVGSALDKTKFRTGLRGQILNAFDDPALKTVMKNEGNMALGAATAMVTTEVLLERAGLDEYKPLALISALAGGMAGVRSLSKIKDMMLVGLKQNSDSPDRFDAALRLRGFSQERIDTMSFKEKSEIALTDPEILKMGRQVGELFLKIQEQDPEMGQKIISGLQYSLKLREQFRKDILQDIDDGVIDKKDLGYLDENIPLLLDQAVMLSGLHKVRDTLVSNLANSGITMNVERFAHISELDKLTNILQKQSDTLELMLENVAKRVKKQRGSEESSTSVLLRNIREFNTDYLQRGEIAKTSLDRIRNVKKYGVDPSNTPALNRAIDGAFGVDDLTEDGIREIARLEGRNIQLSKAREESNRNFETFEDDMIDSLTNSFDIMKRNVNKKYAKVENFEVDVNFLLQDNRYADTLAEASDVLKIFDRETSAGQNRLKRLVQAAKRQGLNRVRNSFQTEEEYLTELINIKANYAEDIDPNFDRDTYVSQALDDNFGVRKDSMGNNIEPNIADNIENLERELINSDYRDVRGKVIGSDISYQIPDPDEAGKFITVEENQHAIPMFMNFDDLHKIRIRVMENTLRRRSKEGFLVKDQGARAEANYFAHIMDHRIDKFIDEVGMDALGISENSSKLLREAKDYYRDTLGATFKRRLGTILKYNIQDSPMDRGIRLPSHKLFQLFFDNPDKRESREIFVRMFSEIDEKGNVIPDTVDPKAKELLLKTARRFMAEENSSYTKYGLNRLDDDIIRHFFESDDINLRDFIGRDKYEEFMSWRTSERDYARNAEGFNAVFDVPGYEGVLENAIKSLSKERQDVLDRSLFAEGAIKGERLDDIFKSTESFHAASEPVFNLQKRAADPNDETYGPKALDKTVSEIEAVDSILAQEKGVFADVDASESLLGKRLISEVVGPPRMAGASTPQNSVRILVDAFANQPEKQKEVVLALREYFVDYVRRNAYAFTDQKAYSNATSGELSPFKLVRDVDLASFAAIMENSVNQRILDDLYGEHLGELADLDQLNRIKNIFDYEVITKGKLAKTPTSFNVPTPLAVNSLISRVYSISRGVVSPKYVASEIYVTQAQLRKGNFMLKMLTDPNITATVEEAMAVSSGQMQISNQFIERFRAMSIALFATQMGEEDTIEIRDNSEIKEQFDFLSDFIRNLSPPEDKGIYLDSPQAPFTPFTEDDLNIDELLGPSR